MKWLFLIALAGHLLCGICDCLLIYMPNGRFRAEYMKDNQKLSKLFDGMPLKLRSVHGLRMFSHVYDVFRIHGNL